MNSQAWPSGAAPTFSPSRLLSYTLRTPTFCKLKRSNFFSIKAESSDEQRSVGVKESPAVNDSEPGRKVSTASSGAWAAVGAVALGVAVFSSTRCVFHSALDSGSALAMYLLKANFSLQTGW